MNEFKPGNTIANRKLTDTQVLELKTMYSEGGWTYGKLAKRFGIAAETVARMIRGESRKTILTAAEVQKYHALLAAEHLRQSLISLDNLKSRIKVGEDGQVILPEEFTKPVSDFPNPDGQAAYKKLLYGD